MSNTAGSASTPVLSFGQFHGTPNSARTVAGFRITQSNYDPFCEIAEHTHENAFFSIVIAGRSREETGSRSYERLPAMLVFHPCRERHANFWGRDGGACLHVELSPSRSEAIQEEGLSLAKSAVIAHPSMARLGSKLMREFVTNDVPSNLAIEGIVLEILAAVTREEGRSFIADRPIWVEKAKQILISNPSSPFSLGELAACLGVSSSHLAVAFRRTYGCTVGDFIRRQRVKSASEKLLSTDVSLGLIALECGFADQSHFSRVFKSTMGESPAQYRRNRLADRRFVQESNS
jgi:AraC family transcriptional regulator